MKLVLIILLMTICQVWSMMSWSSSSSQTGRKSWKRLLSFKKGDPYLINICKAGTNLGSSPEVYCTPDQNRSNLKLRENDTDISVDALYCFCNFYKDKDSFYVIVENEKEGKFWRCDHHFRKAEYFWKAKTYTYHP